MTQLIIGFSISTISAAIYGFNLFVLVIILSSTYAFYNPIFLYVVLQLTVYSPTWLPVFAQGTFSNDTFNNWTKFDVKNSVTIYFLLSILWVNISVLSYSFFKLKVNFRARDQATNYKFYGICICVCAFIAFGALLVQVGSVADFILQRHLSRSDRLAAELGRHFFFVAQSGTFGVMLWAAKDPKFHQSLMFWCLTLLVVSTGFLVSGNRTSILLLIIVLYFFWFVHTGKLINWIGVVVTCVLVVLLSVATNIRTTGSLTFEAGQTTKGVQELVDQRIERATSGNAAFGLIHHVGKSPSNFLLGESYKSVPYVFIPSKSLDEAKPYAGGRLAAKTLANRDDTAWPIGHIIEAYWNFGLIGVILNAVLYGGLSRYVSQLLMSNRDSTFVLVTYLLYVFFFSLGSDGIYKFTQPFVVIWLIYSVLGRSVQHKPNS